MACVYKIFCNDISITDCYIGSTIDFRRRRKGHISRCNNINCPQYNYNIYKFIRENGGWDNWTIVKLEDCEEDNKVKLEQKYYEELQPTLNSRPPLSSRKETEARYREKESTKKRKKEWYEKNKDKIAKKNKERYEKNKDAINKKRKEAREAKKKLLKK